MNINASIVDQRLSGIIESHPEWFPWPRDPNKRKSAAFVVLCMATALDLDMEDCADILTEGGNDAGVDGIHLGEVEDGSFVVTLFQGKYRVNDLSGEANFPENGVNAALQTIEVLFDPYREVQLNPKLQPRIAEVRSLIRDGDIPTVRVLLCNNGAPWQHQADRWVAEAKAEYGATNSQSPVDLRDLHANDDIQKTLALGIEQLGYVYKHHREDGVSGENVITSAMVAEAALAVWRERPHQARFRRPQHFGKLYDLIFQGLNAGAALTAALIHRDVERRRREATDDEVDAFPFLPYASHHLAMLVGRKILDGLDVDRSAFSDRHFEAANQTLQTEGDLYYARAKTAIEDAIRACYGDRPVSLQQLAATFRRGDLLEMLPPVA